MKRLALIMLIVTGCANVGQIYPPPAVPVCAKPEAADSVICAIATRQGYAPEQIDSMFLDAALAGIGAKVFSAADLRAALQKTRDWVVDRDILSVQGLTMYLSQTGRNGPRACHAAIAPAGVNQRANPVTGTTDGLR